MKKISSTLLSITTLILSLCSCHRIEDFGTSPQDTFDQLWTIMDQHYCFFEEKNIDWNEVGNRYRSRISDNMTQEELFDVCSLMLAELRDGHTNLSSPFATSYYRKWWSDYPQNYNARLVEQYYFNFNYRTTGGIDYGILAENVGYLHYSSFSAGIGEGNLDAILSYCATCCGLIIDVRDNSGGDMTNVEKIVARFISQPITAGSICHKTGPGHNDFSEPFPYIFNPCNKDRMRWGKPVVVLCNRSTFSAANNFVSVMKTLPNVKIAGATTGGGSGMPFSSELTNGWGIRFSASPVRDPQGQLTEFGVTPTEGCAVDLDPEAALSGHDTILDFAINLLLSIN